MGRSDRSLAGGAGRSFRTALLLLTLAGCEGGPLGLFRSESPYERYLESLQHAGLDSTALGLDWARAGEEALLQPVAARLPFRETGYLPPHTASAVAYRFELRRGRRLAIDISFASEPRGRLFVDLFQLRDGEPPRRVVGLSPDTSLLRYEVRRDGSYLLRLQPELLRGGRYTLVQRTEATLGFPVPGHDVSAVRSRFGAERDAGARTHHGIDIFAERGTPVIALVSGIARADLNNLGGQVVWLRDAERGRSLYYAHLDGWAISEAERVEPGDTLGFIGNTGNARTTRPHLHFGIYERGPVDPLPFVLPDDPHPAAVAAPENGAEEWVRVSRVRGAVLRAGAHQSSDTLRALEQGWLARVSAVTRGAFRVSLPDRLIGYLDADAVTSADRPVRRAWLEAGSVIREAPRAASPAIEILAEAEEAAVLGRFEDFELVRLADGRRGWIVTSVNR